MLICQRLAIGCIELEYLWFDRGYAEKNTCCGSCDFPKSHSLAFLCCALCSAASDSSCPLSVKPSPAQHIVVSRLSEQTFAYIEVMLVSTSKIIPCNVYDTCISTLWKTVTYVSNFSCECLRFQETIILCMAASCKCRATGRHQVGSRLEIYLADKTPEDSCRVLLPMIEPSCGIMWSILAFSAFLILRASPLAIAPPPPPLSLRPCSRQVLSTKAARKLYCHECKLHYSHLLWSNYICWLVEGLSISLKHSECQNKRGYGITHTPWLLKAILQ